MITTIFAPATAYSMDAELEAVKSSVFDAIFAGDLTKEKLDIAIAAGFDIHTDWYGYPALLYVLKRDNIATYQLKKYTTTFKALLAAGAKVNACHTDTNETVLHRACKVNYLWAVSFLLKHKASIKVVDKLGRRPLDILLSRLQSEQKVFYSPYASRIHKLLAHQMIYGTVPVIPLLLRAEPLSFIKSVRHPEYKYYQELHEHPTVQEFLDAYHIYLLFHTVRNRADKKDDHLLSSSEKNRIQHLTAIPRALVHYLVDLRSPWIKKIRQAQK